MLSHGAFKKLNWDRVMAQWSKARVSLAKNWPSVPSTHVSGSRTPGNLVASLPFAGMLARATFSHICN